MAPAEEEGSEVIVNSYKGGRARRLSYTSPLYKAHP